MKFKILFITISLLLSNLCNATINIGTLMFKPPYIVSPSSGFDIDMARQICRRLQEDCRFIPMDIDALYDKLKNGTIDLAMGGIPISYALNIQFIFSLPYMLSKGQLLILKNSKLSSFSDLKGETIGVLKNRLNGGVLYDYLFKNYQKLFQIQLYDSVEQIMSDLNNKKIAAAFLNRSSVNYWLIEGGAQFRAFGNVHTIGNGVAIVALPKNNALINRINSVIQDMEKDGSYSKLYNIYFANE